MKDESGRWDAQRASAELDGWRRSGLSLAEYARRRGLTAGRLQRWKRALSAESVELVPVVVRDAPAMSARGVVVEGAGYRVVVDALTAESAAWVAALVRAERAS